MYVHKRLLTWLLVSLAFAPATVHAEIYKCRGPNGDVIFTSHQEQCPGAQVHQPKKRLQHSGTPHHTEPSPAQRHPAAAAPPDPEEAMAARWRQKKASSQKRLEKLQQTVPKLERVVGWCNHGDDLYYEDEDGIRHGMSCDRVGQEYAKQKAEMEQLEQYLAEGLEEECRRSGCLPGWIR